MTRPQSQLVVADPADPHDPGAMELALADVVGLLGELADQDTCPGCGSDGADGEDHAADCPIMAMLAQLKPYAEGNDRFNAIEPAVRP